MIKSTIFLSFSNFSTFDFGVINFNKSNYKEEKYGKFLSNATTLLFTRSNESITPYYVMVLKYDEGEMKTIVETLYAPLELGRFVDGQELIIPTQILSTDNSTMELTKLTGTAQEKIEILRMYKSILVGFNIQANINIMDDYQNMLIESLNKVHRK